MFMAVQLTGLDPSWLAGWLESLALSPWLRWSLTLAYISVLVIISIYGLHRYYLVYLFYKHARTRPRPASHFSSLPRVTVQLPLFNEASVGRRIIDAACQLDYPRDRLQIQVLDDSTDHSATIARQAAEHWQARGLDIQYIHRTNRRGFKAGALADAMDRATGQFITIFDADFIPPANFLKRTIHYFTDPAIGMVQTRWTHLNRDNSLLTRCQAIFLDGHFVIEHAARNRSGCWINFNGTAGLWRKTTIADAGGWHADTLTEDVDLSYRAQLAGWQFIYAPWVVCPAELPPQINAFKTQQHRWTKGTIQTAIKLLPTLLTSNLPWKIKREAFFHLTSPVVYVCVCLMVLLFYPAFFVNLQPFDHATLAGSMWGLMLFATGTASAGAFYVASQRALKRDLWTTLWHLPLLMGIGIGIAINNARAVLEALIGHQSPFVRTPKYNQLATARDAGNLAPIQEASEDTTELNSQATSQTNATPNRRLQLFQGFRGIRGFRGLRGLRAHRLMPFLELAMGLYMLECIYLALSYQRTQMSLPFLIIFVWGYFSVGIASFWQMFITPRLLRRRHHALLAAKAGSQVQEAVAKPAA